MSELRDRRTRLRVLALLGGLKLLVVAALIAAAAARPWLVLGALALSAVTESAVMRVAPPIGTTLWRLHLPPLFGAVRWIALVLLAARCLGESALVTTAVSGSALFALTIAIEALSTLVNRLRELPLEARNLDLAGFTLPALLPAIVRRPPAESLPVVVAIGLAVSSHRGGGLAPVVVSITVASLAVLIPVALLVNQLAHLARSDLRGRLAEAATVAIEQLAPEVVLYFAATPAELYQVEMWLAPLERLGRPAAIVLRDRAVLERLAGTSIPVVCSPYNGTIASLPLPAKVVALFVTHSGNNLSMIRRPEARTVFIGHGDSDKPDSVNPFARVYDEIWVAGPLGRRRYAEANVGISDDNIVEIGRPQVTMPPGTPPQTPTVVYAPTWEGWGDDDHHSSLAHIGPALIAKLAARPDLRVRYRPHPLTGRRSAALRSAHERIIELVGRVPPDEPLTETFNQASALIGDVSSVINEFLPYDRPYAVPDTRGLGAVEFAARFPSTSGGFVLSPELDGLDEFIDAALGGADPTSASRRTLLADALGDPATSQQRFAAAVFQLLAR